MGAEKGAGGERPAKIRHPSISFEHLEVSVPLALTDWVCRVSHTCAPVGFRFPPHGESACCAPGFLFMLLLVESCWYEVSHSLWLPWSQHVPSCTFHSYKPCCWQEVKYVKKSGRSWSLFFFLSPSLLTLYLSLLLFLIDLLDTNQKCKHLSWCNIFCASGCTRKSVDTLTLTQGPTYGMCS